MARPKRVFTGNETRLIARYALNGGKNNTIASALDMPVNTLTNRFSTLLKKSRAKRKLKLRKNQTIQARTSSDMAKFLGTNELGQAVKVENIEKTEPIKPLTVAERAIIQEAASKILLLKLNEPKSQESA